MPLPLPSTILKPLDADCMLRGQLHPMIRDRLGRVRELAMTQVANLHAVVREKGRAFMVWEYVQGQTLEEWLAAGPTATQLRKVHDDLAHIVESLHALGIVHGAIHERNVIITPAGAVKLTHVSPLLWDDPENDLQAVQKLLQLTRLGKEQRLGKEHSPPTAQGAQTADTAQDPPLRHTDEDRRIRRSILMVCVVVVVAAAALAYGLWRAMDPRG